MFMIGIGSLASIGVAMGLMALCDREHMCEQGHKWTGKVTTCPECDRPCWIHSDEK